MQIKNYRTFLEEDVAAWEEIIEGLDVPDYYNRFFLKKIKFITFFCETELRNFLVSPASFA